MFFAPGFAQAVAEFDDGERLDEEGGSGGGDVVDDGGHLAAEFGLDRDDVASVALGDQGFLGDALGDGVAEGALELLFESVLDGADAVAGLGEGGGGVVGDFAALVDGGFDLSDYGGEVGDALGDAGELGEFSGEGGDLVACVSGGAEEDGDFEDVAGGQDGASGGGEEVGGDVGGLSHVEVRLEPSQRSRFGGGGEAAADLIGVGAGRELLGEVAAAGGAAEVGEALDDLGELEDGDALGVHLISPLCPRIKCGAGLRHLFPEEGRNGMCDFDQGRDITDAPGVL